MGCVSLALNLLQPLNLFPRTYRPPPFVFCANGALASIASHGQIFG